MGLSSSMEILCVMTKPNISRSGQFQVDYVSKVRVALSPISLTISFPLR